jgi:hypothetical protein
MWATLTAALLFAAPADPVKVDKDAPALKLELFAKEDWYKDEKGKEEDFVGVLQFKDRKGVVGFGRFNPYTLVTGDGDKKTVREVYVGGKPDLLTPYIGKKLKLTGKAVDMEVEGEKHNEIWPARLELLADDKPKDKEDKPDSGKEPPAKADILADNKLYKMEPGPEKEFVGVLEKQDKGGYALVMKKGDDTTKESLIVYDGKYDPLEPYAGKRVKVTGKQVMGAVGFRTFSHILPGRLEVLPEEKDK